MEWDMNEWWRWSWFLQLMLLQKHILKWFLVEGGGVDGLWIRPLYRSSLQLTPSAAALPRPLHSVPLHIYIATMQVECHYLPSGHISFHKEGGVFYRYIIKLLCSVYDDYIHISSQK